MCVGLASAWRRQSVWTEVYPHVRGVSRLDCGLTTLVQGLSPMCVGLALGGSMTATIARVYPHVRGVSVMVFLDPITTNGLSPFAWG